MNPTKTMIFYSLLSLLLSNAATLRRDMSILYSRVAITILLHCFLISFLSLFLYVSLSRGIGLYGGLFHATSLTQISHMFIFLVSAVILQLTAFYPRRVWSELNARLYNLFVCFYSYFGVRDYSKILNKLEQQFKIIEYPLIILFIITGAIFLVSTSDIVSIFLSIELQSYGLYLFSTLYRNSELSTSAGLTYFLLGGLSSCFILLGTSLLYANSGTTNLDGFYVITSLSNISNQDYINNVIYWYKPFYINISLVIMSVGFLFKVSAAPFHFWSPDVYDAIPTVVTTFVAIIAKISIFLFLIELVHYTSNGLFSDKFSWTYCLLISSFLSLIIGTVLGLTQFRIKRLFAYSTISHVGFILLALSINSLESIQACIFYIMQYTISNLNAFILLISIGFSNFTCIMYDYFSVVISNKKHKAVASQKINFLEKNNSPIQLITQLKGYFFLNPLLALSLAITLFSLVGIPPLIGFFSKQMVLSAALDSGFVFLALIAILTSVVSAVYYLGIIKQIFFDIPEDDSIDLMFQSGLLILKDLHGEKKEELETIEELEIIEELEKNPYTTQLFKIYNIFLSTYLTITVSSFTLILLFFLFTPQEWLSMANLLALIMFNS